MSLDDEGKRRRYYSERVALDENEGDPLRDQIGQGTRMRMIREILSRARSVGSVDLKPHIEAELRRVLGTQYWGNFHAGTLEDTSITLKLPMFLDVLEICVEVLTRHRQISEDVQILQSLLRDDSSAFRFRNVGTGAAPEYQVQAIHNPHLHREVVDRTFELTRNNAFESAQRDYREAWTHFGRADFDDALVNAHKGVESACKIVIDKVDPTKNPGALELRHLVPILVELDILPSRLQHMVNQLEQIFRSAGSLRNDAGTGHGSLDLRGPEASVAMLGLRLSGSLIAFLAERWEQLAPARTGG